MSNSAKETILLINGTFAGPTEGAVKWYMPGSDFCRQLDSKLSEFGCRAQTWAHLDDSDRPYFSWDGGNTWQSRVKAAEDLASEIADLRRSRWRCHLVAHSHGGTVTIDAIRKLGFDADTYDGNVVLLGTPVYTRSQSRLPFLNLSSIIGLTLSLLTWFVAIFLIAIPLSDYSVNIVPESTWIIWLSGTLIIVLAAIRLFFFLLGRLLESEIYHDGPGGIHIPKMPKLVCMWSDKDEVYRLFTEVVSGPNPLNSDLVENATTIRWHERSTNALKRAVNALKRAVEDSLSVDSMRFPSTLAGKILLIPLVGIFFIALFLYFSSFIGRTDSQFFTWIESTGWISIIVKILFTLLVIVSVLSPRTLRDHLLLPWRFIGIIGSSINSVVRMMAARPMANLAWSTVRAWTMGLAGAPYSAAHTVVSMRPEGFGNCGVMELPDAVVAETLARQNESAKQSVKTIIHELSQSKNWSPSTITELFMKASLPGLNLVHSAYYEHADCIDLIAVWLSVDEKIRESVSKNMENSRFGHNQDMRAATVVKNIRHVLSQRSR